MVANLSDFESRGDPSVRSMRTECRVGRARRNVLHLLGESSSLRRAGQIRTDDPLLPKQVRYQAAPQPVVWTTIVAQFRAPPVRIIENVSYLPQQQRGQAITIGYVATSSL
jgi:hypothetical protein